MTPLIKYQGKRFVRLCGCNRDFHKDVMLFFIDRIKFFTICDDCNKAYWIILPKEGEK